MLTFLKFMKKLILFLSVVIISFSSIPDSSWAKKKSSRKTKYTVKKVKEAPTPKKAFLKSVPGFADIIEGLLPSVVNISGTQNNPNIPESSANTVEEILSQEQNNILSSSIGSGFIFSKDGIIVTNYHVIKGSKEITVTLNDGDKYQGKILGIDKKSDLALLKIDTKKELKPLKLGDSNKVRIGDWIIIIGNPYGLGQSASIGIVSAKSRNLRNGHLEEFIQTDAAINTGNSGGPMLNLDGEVIGISTIILSPTGGNVGIGFATPASRATRIIKELKEKGEVTRGWIGITVQEVSEEIAESMKIEKNNGAFVNDVLVGGPANMAGIKASDVIVKIDNKDVTEMRVLPRIISRYPIGKTAKITVIRDGKIRVLKVKIMKMPEEETVVEEFIPVTPPVEKQKLSVSDFISNGIGVIEINEVTIKKLNITSAKQGLLVTEVEPDSQAAKKGIIPGDIIISANQNLITSIPDLIEAIEFSKKSAEQKLLLFIRRNELSYPISLNLKNK